MGMPGSRVTIPGPLCPICGAGCRTVQVCSSNYPAYLMPLPPTLASEVVRAPLELVACGDCGHIYVAARDLQLQGLIYETCYTHYLQDAEESHHPHYRKPFIQFVSSLAAANVFPRGRWLEIGCSTGEQVPFFRTIAEDYTGVDPSFRIQQARSRFPAARFIRGYFPQAVPGEWFDVVGAQFLLELTADPGARLRAVFERCTSYAVLLVQAPDAVSYLNDGLPIYWAHEHLQYFQRPQLELLLRRQGFDPISWADAGPSLICGARRTSAPATQEGWTERDPLAAARQHARLFRNRPNLPNGPVAFYGVGPPLYWVLQDCPPLQQVAVIVDNPSYHGWAVPGYGYGILRPSAELFESFPDVALTLNRIYHGSVLTKLRDFAVPIRVHIAAGDQWEVLNIGAQAEEGST